MRHWRPNEAAPRTVGRGRSLSSSKPGSSHRPELAPRQAKSLLSAPPGVGAALRPPAPAAPGWAGGCRAGRTPARGSLQRLQAGIAPCWPRGPREAAAEPSVDAGPEPQSEGQQRLGQGVKAGGQTLGTPRRRTGRAQRGQTAIKTSEALAPPRREKGKKISTPAKNRARRRHFHPDPSSADLAMMPTWRVAGD